MGIKSRVGAFGCVGEGGGVASCRAGKRWSGASTVGCAGEKGMGIAQSSPTVETAKILPPQAVFFKSLQKLVI